MNFDAKIGTHVTNCPNKHLKPHASIVKVTFDKVVIHVFSKINKLFY